MPTLITLTLTFGEYQAVRNALEAAGAVNLSDRIRDQFRVGRPLCELLEHADDMPHSPRSH